MEKVVLDPVATVSRDLVGYTGDGEFFILNSVKDGDRKLPTHLHPRLPSGIRCVIKNNQAINFLSGSIATLHDINSVWNYRMADGKGLDSPIKVLPTDIFFEIGPCK